TRPTPPMPRSSSTGEPEWSCPGAWPREPAALSSAESASGRIDRLEDAAATRISCPLGSIGPVPGAGPRPRRNRAEPPVLRGRGSAAGMGATESAQRGEELRGGIHELLYVRLPGDGREREHAAAADEHSPIQQAEVIGRRGGGIRPLSSVVVADRLGREV